MKDLTRTSSFGLDPDNQHYHIIYLNEDGGYGATSFEDGHVHQVTYQAPQAQQVDEQGNVVAPAVEAAWIIGPGLDGHTHDIEAYERKEPRRQETDEEIIDMVLSLYKSAKDNEVDSIRMGKESEGFYIGDGQWDKETKDALESLDRAALTINTTQKLIDEICGYERDQRSEIHFSPEEDGDQRVADLLNVIAKHILDSSDYQREKSEVFEDEVIVGRGAFNLYVTFDEDLEGEIKVERFPWDQVVFGPHEKKDASDCEYLIKEKMYSKAKLKQLFGDKAEEIESRFTEIISEVEEHTTYASDQYAAGISRYPVTAGGTALIDIAKKEIRLLECWQSIYVDGIVAANPADRFYGNLYGWDAKDVKAVGRIPDANNRPLFTLIKQRQQKLRISKVAGGVVLSDENPADLPADKFFIIPVYAKKRKNKFWGKVELLKDPQRETNKRRSQVIDITNKMASYGYFYDQGTFPEGEKEKFKRVSSSPGFMVEVNDVSRPPLKVEGVKFPQEIVQLLQMDMQNLQDLANISIAPRGANTSGAAIAQEQKIRMVGNGYLFENMSFAQQRLGRLLIKVIQRYYPPDRIWRLVSRKAQKEPVSVGGEDFSSFSEDEIKTLLETADLSQYDVKVTETDWSPSVKLATHLLLADLAGKGIAVPPEALIETMDLPDEYKKKLLDSIAAQAQAAAQAEGEKGKAEIAKTLVGQGIIPPEVQQQFGIQVPQQLNQESPQAAPAAQHPPAGIAEGKAPEQVPVVLNVNVGKDSTRKRARFSTDPVSGERVAHLEDVPEEIAA